MCYGTPSRNRSVGLLSRDSETDLHGKTVSLTSSLLLQCLSSFQHQGDSIMGPFSIPLRDCEAVICAKIDPNNGTSAVPRSPSLSSFSVLCASSERHQQYAVQLCSKRYCRIPSADRCCYRDESSTVRITRWKKAERSTEDSVQKDHAVASNVQETQSLSLHNHHIH